MLKIIAGYARGIALETPDSRLMRPTLGRAREALFSSLGPLDGATFADLFAGSGAIGLEAASRGARRVIWVDSNPACVRLIERNIAKVRRAGADFAAETLCRSVSPALLRTLPEADIWFADPPYAESGRCLAMLGSGTELPLFRRDGGLLVWELPDTAEAMRDFAGNPLLSAGRVRELGGVRFLFLRREDLT